VLGLVEGSLPTPRVRHGAVLGAVVWLSDYAILPLAGLYRPLWKYEPVVLARDLADHLGYGTAAAAAFRLLAR
jgi:hypothetical protein